MRVRVCVIGPARDAHRLPFTPRVCVMYPTESRLQPDVKQSMIQPPTTTTRRFEVKAFSKVDSSNSPYNLLRIIRDPSEAPEDETSPEDMLSLLG